MALVPTEVKTALKLLNSIDISLGRIATALEKQNESRKEKDNDESRDS